MDFGLIEYVLKHIPERGYLLAMHALLFYCAGWQSDENEQETLPRAEVAGCFIVQMASKKLI